MDTHTHKENMHTSEKLLPENMPVPSYIRIGSYERMDSPGSVYQKNVGAQNTKIGYQSKRF